MAADIITPEAIGVPKVNPLQRSWANAPEIDVANAATALTVYDEATGNEPPCESIFVQNLSATPVKYAYNMVAGENAFHGILAAGVAQDDGLGGNTLLEVRRFGMKSVSLWCGAAAIRVCVAKYICWPIPGQTGYVKG